MKGKKGQITAFQLYALLFSIQVLMVLFINGSFTGGNDFLDNTVSCLLAAGLNLLFSLPLFLLYRADQTMSIPEWSVHLLGKKGKGVALYYGAYLLFMDGIYLSLFQVLMANVIEPHSVPWVLSLITVIAACYAATLGLEASARAGVFLMVLVLAGTGLLFSGLLVQADFLHFQPLFIDGARQTVQGCLVFFSFGTQLPLLALVLPAVRGKVQRGFVLWNLLTALFMALLILVAVASCGDYLRNQLFPLYTAASMARLSFFERMDMLFVVAWMCGLFLKLSLDLCLIQRCIGFFTSRGKYLVILLAGGALLLLSQVVFHNAEFKQMLLDLVGICILSFIGAAGIPWLLLGVRKWKEGKADEKTEG